MRGSTRISDAVLDELRRAPVLLVAEHLGIRLGPRGRGPCVLCGTSPRSTSFSIDRKHTGRWKCFACNESGDSIKLVRAFTGCSFVEAASIVADVIGVDLGRPVDPVVRQGADDRRREREASLRRERWRNRAAHAVADLIHEIRWRCKIITQHPHEDRERDADDLTHLADAEVRLIYLHECLCDPDEAVANEALERLLDIEIDDADEVAA